MRLELKGLLKDLKIRLNYKEIDYKIVIRKRSPTERVNHPKGWGAKPST